MSDYLWDKSGEPEAEVERLEELLGRLRHARGANELPFEVEAHASRLGVEVERAGLFSSAGLLRPARLAAAAALLLAALAGALVMLRSSSKGDGRAASDAAQVTRPQTGAHEEVRVPEERRAPERPRAPGVAAPPSNQLATPERLTNKPAQRDEFAAAKTFPKLQRRELATREAAANEPAQRVVRTASARGASLDGGANDLQSRVRAKEQLVYALRLTSEALKEVRGRASGMDARGNAFDGRSPLR